MNETCKERINDEYADRIETIESILDRIDLQRFKKGNGHDIEDPDYVEVAETELDEYGLCFDYVEPNTFEDQKRGYLRWQLSWGGPSDEFRFFIDEQGGITDIEYHFMDWFDGAVIDVNMSSYDGKKLDYEDELLEYDADILVRAFDWLTAGEPLWLVERSREAV